MKRVESPFLYRMLLDGEGGARVIKPADIASWEPSQGVLWLHVDASSSEVHEWARDEGSLDESVTQILFAEETRPRSIGTQNGFLIVLRGLNTNPDEDPEDMVSIRLWIEDHRVISAQRRKLLSVEDVLGTFVKKSGPTSAGDVLSALIKRLAERIGDFVDSIEDRLSQAEENLATANHAQFRKELSTLRRQTAAVRRFLAPQRDALDRMYRQPGPWFSDAEITIIREESDRITRYLEDLDLARERAVVLQEELLSEIAQEQNSRMYVLSVVAAIFLPLTFVTGLLGMNVGGLPGIENPSGFWVSMVVMLVSAAGLMWFFKMKKWI